MFLIHAKTMIVSLMALKIDGEGQQLGPLRDLPRLLLSLPMPTAKGHVVVVCSTSRLLNTLHRSCFYSNITLFEDV